MERVQDHVAHRQHVRRVGQQRSQPDAAGRRRGVDTVVHRPEVRGGEGPAEEQREQHNLDREDEVLPLADLPTPNQTV